MSGHTVPTPAPVAAGLSVSAEVEAWPLTEPFVISRGTKTVTTVVVAEVRSGNATGRGECVPYARYGETPAGVMTEIDAAKRWIEPARSPAEARHLLAHHMRAGAARNALDCALWDLEARLSGLTVAHLVGLAIEPAAALVTAYTLSLDTPDAMAAKAKAAADLPLLKLKLGGSGDADRMKAIRAARPDARLIADANEAWTDALLAPLMAAAAETRCELIEQPLPAGADSALAHVDRKVPVCADESLHTRADLAGLRDRYDAINIKLDKTGGLTEAIALAGEAANQGFDVMIGSMVSTSLALAPALILARRARWIDLDGPLLLARDRPHGLSITKGIIAPASQALWG